MNNELDSIYKKGKNGRYYPVGVCYEPNWLPDGIWLVSHSPGSTSHKNLNYYANIYKVGCPKYLDYSIIAGNLEIADKVMNDPNVRKTWDNNHTLHDITNSIVSSISNIILDEKSPERSNDYTLITSVKLKEDGFVYEGNSYVKELVMSHYKVIVEELQDDRRWLVKYQSKYSSDIVGTFKASTINEIYQHLEIL